jgi:MYXO-CTERM domain-containing protein
VLETDNDYSGGTNITGGTVQVGNGGTTGSIIGTVTLNGGTLVFNRYDDVTYTGNIIIAGSAGLAQNGTGSLTITTPLAAGVNMLSLGGTGNLTVGATVSGGGIINKDGSGMLTLLANNNAFTGTLNVNAGTVLLNDLGAGGDLGATAIVVNSGGTFIFGPNGNADLPDATVVTINAGGLFRIEQGENFGGYMLNGGEFRYVSSGNTGVNSTGVASVAGGVVFDLRSGTITTDITAPGTGGSLNSTNGGILTKTTSGTVTVSGSVVFQSGLAMQLKEGTLAMNPNNVPASGLAMITLGDLETTGTLQINGTGSATTSRPFTLEVGGGTVNVVSAGTRLTINGSLTGTGGLTKAGDGALVLNASSDYFGGTTVVSGTLEVDNVFGSGTGSGPLIVNGTLAGNGGIDTTSSGNNVAINGVLSIGAAGAIEGADFNIATGVGGRTSFGASSIARLDLWSTSGTDQTVFLTAADLLLVSGDLQIDSGATLALGNPNGLSFQPGDVFRLFDWSFLGVRTGTWNIDASALNLGDLSLDTSELYTSGTVAITGVPEAGTGLLAMLGMGTFLLRRRRRSFIR